MPLKAHHMHHQPVLGARRAWCKFAGGQASVDLHAPSTPRERAISMSAAPTRLQGKGRRGGPQLGMCLCVRDRSGILLQRAWKGALKEESAAPAVMWLRPSQETHKHGRRQHRLHAALPECKLVGGLVDGRIAHSGRPGHARAQSAWRRLRGSQVKGERRVRRDERGLL